MGAIGNLGVSAYIAGASSSLDISTGKSTSNPVPSAVSGLQEQVAELTKQLLELKHLEKNKDKVPLIGLSSV